MKFSVVFIQIPPEGLVCYACWVAARRNVERARRIGSKHHTPGRQKRHQNSLCTWCRKSLRKRPRHVATGQVRDEVTAGIYPIEVIIFYLSNHILVMSNSLQSGLLEAGSAHSIPGFKQVRFLESNDPAL